MKIFHASLTREFAGSEMYCASLAEAQAAGGDEVRVVVRDTPYVARWKQELGQAEVLVIPGWVPNFLERWVVGKMMKGFEPEVVHTHLGRADAVGGKAARWRKTPWVTTVHLRWKDEAMRRASAAICIAGWQKAEIVGANYRGITRIIWNWLPKQRAAALNEVAALRKEWNAGEATVVFGSVGRLHGKKGMDVLVKSFRAAYPDTNADVRLVIVGEGSERLKLEGLRGPDRRIIFVGYRPDLSAFYGAFDTYVSAARYEPFGLTILEAMGHGCRLVCSKTEGPSEFLREASTRGQVLWAGRGDEESLAAALKVAQTQGRGRVTYDLRQFGVERAVKEIREVYEEVIGERVA